MSEPKTSGPRGIARESVRVTAFSERDTNRWSSIGVAVLLTILTWPVRNFASSSGLDPSWHIGLHLAAHLRLRFGQDIVFTYGPLGFLSEPQLVYRWTAAAAVVYAVLVQLAFIWVVYVLVRRWLHPIGAVLLTFFIGLLVPFEPAELVPIIVICWLIGKSDQRADREPVPAGRRLVLISASLAGLHLLVKFDVGLQLIALTAFLILLQEGKRILPLAQSLLILVGTFAAFWVLTGNRLSDVTRWFVGSMQLQTGFGAAMGQETPNRWFEYPIAALLLISLVLLMVLRERRESSHVPWQVIGALTVLTYFEFRHAFVLHESQHSVLFFFYLAVVASTIKWPRVLIPTAITYTTAALAIAAIVPLPTANRLPDTFKGPGRAWRQVSTLISSAKSNSELLAEKKRITAALTLDDATINLLRSRTVAIDPVEVSLAWAYGLKWRPLPVFQLYSAYTRYLDALNVDALQSRGPDRILRQHSFYFAVGNPPEPIRAIDGRNPYFESPAAFFQMLCRYRELNANSFWEVLGRANDRCGSRNELGVVDSSAGRLFQAPHVDERSMLLARVDIHQSTSSLVWGWLFKPLQHPEIQIDDTRFQLVGGTSVGPLVLCVPEAAGFSSDFVPSQCPTSIRIWHTGSFRVTFFAVRIT